MQTINVADVQYREDLYPRASFDQETVNRYRLALDNLPPILVNPNNILIDGYHRLIAHRIEQRDTIAAEVLNVADDDVLWCATETNARHGFQLSREDKKRLARAFLEQGRTPDDIATVLSVSDKTVDRWTDDLQRKRDEDLEQRMIDMYLAGHTYPEIAKACGYNDESGARKAIERKKGQMSNFPAPDSLQVFNEWRFNSPDDRYGLEYPGRIPGQILENLLWYYTEPFDLVVDPMGGGGVTIDVCKVMYRRYQAYDIHPVRNDIRAHDLTHGFHKDARGAALIFFDPPYWKQKRGDYSDDANNLANLSLEAFYGVMLRVLMSAYDTLKPGGVAALIIGPTQEHGVIHDHAMTIGRTFESAGFAYENRVIVPYTTQQVSGADVAQAKNGKYMLKLYRDLLVYRRPG